MKLDRIRLRAGQMWVPSDPKRASCRGINRVRKGEVWFQVGLFPDSCSGTQEEFEDWIQENKAVPAK